jgi:High potential iron-sulfur protein
VTPANSRRRFLQLMIVATPVAVLGRSAAAQDLPHLPESDPTATALGYKEDVAKVDATKFPTYKPGLNCANCNFYQGKDKEAYGPCQLFAGKAVAAKGWCAGYAAKPKA